MFVGLRLQQLGQRGDEAGRADAHRMVGLRGEQAAVEPLRPVMTHDSFAAMSYSICDSVSNIS